MPPTIWRCSLSSMHHYLYGLSFVVWSDHVILQFFSNQSTLNNRQIRWQEYLVQFQLTIIYKLGKQNVISNALFRILVISDFSYVFATTDFNAHLQGWLSNNKEFAPIIRELRELSSTLLSKLRELFMLFQHRRPWPLAVHYTRRYAPLCPSRGWMARLFDPRKPRT
jgi:hypothetical protein